MADIISGKLMPDSIIALQRYVSGAVKQYYAISKINKLKFIENPKQNPMLSEVYYENDVCQETKQKINENIVCCSKTIYSLLDELVHVKEEHKILEIEALNSFEFATDYSCYLKIDLLTKDDNGRHYITDWKTGKYNEESIGQLLAYCFYVSHHYNVCPQNIECKLFYLNSGDVITFCFTQDDFDAFEECLRLDFSRMQTFIQAGTKNTPIAEINFDRSRSNCKNCNFREMCCA